MRAYYNEHDPFAAAWLRNLIADGLIAPGDVDTRDVRAVQPADLAGYTQHHFFAGIGGWSYALRLAGWPDDRSVWTGSCPCQPFSAAGKGKGFDDERHLWPAWFRLIRECRPPVVFGEQVSSPNGLAWLDTVSADLEAEAYALGALDLCAAGVGAPHARQRLYFVADTTSSGRRQGGKRRVPTGQGSERPEGRRDRADGRTATEPSGLCAPRAVADPAGPRRRGRSVRSQHRGGQAPLCAHDARRTAGARQPERGCAGSLADALRERRQGDKRRARTGQQPLPARGSVVGHAASAGLALGSEPPARQGTLRLEGPSAPAASHWSDVVWLPCLDGRVRPAPAGVFPLAHGVPNRVGTLRGAGNAIVPQIAAEFIAAYMEVRA